MADNWSPSPTKEMKREGVRGAYDRPPAPMMKRTAARRRGKKRK